jgi:hypothetical protein
MIYYRIFFSHLPSANVRNAHTQTNHSYHKEYTHIRRKPFNESAAMTPPKSSQTSLANHRYRFLALALAGFIAMAQLVTPTGAAIRGEESPRQENRRRLLELTLDDDNSGFGRMDRRNRKTESEKQRWKDERRAFRDGFKNKSTSDKKRVREERRRAAFEERGERDADGMDLRRWTAQERQKKREERIRAAREGRSGGGDLDQRYRRSDSEKQRWKEERQAFRENYKNLSHSKKHAARRQERERRADRERRRRDLLDEDEGIEL